jgi:hypothetical protein
LVGAGAHNATVTVPEEPADPAGIKATVVTAAMVREGDPEWQGDEDFLNNALRQLFHHWISPALPPGLTEGDVWQAVIVMGAHGPQVRVNDDVRYVACAGRTADLLDPAGVFVGQIRDVWPDGVDPDAGWAGFTTADGGRVLVFDYRSSRQRVGVLLERAAQFARSAELALGEGLLAPGVEHLCSAAEQAVMTLIQLDGWNDRKSHTRRREWLADRAQAGQVAAPFSRTFDVLLANRNAARYAEQDLALDVHAAGVAAGVVRSMIEYARTRRGA